jgi:hypothetical protein
MRSTASDRPIVTVDSSSTWTMRSPASMPAFAAGLPSITRMTVICVSRMPTSMPEAAEAALGAGLHGLEVVGPQQVGVRVERAEHALDDRVLGGALLVLAQRGVAVTKRNTSRTWVPTAHSASTSPIWNSCSAVPTRTRTRWAFLPATPDRLDQDLRDRLLQALEARDGHPVRVDALGLDVVLGDVPQGPVEDPQVGGVVALGDPSGVRGSPFWACAVVSCRVVRASARASEPNTIAGVEALAKRGRDGVCPVTRPV